MILTPWMGQCAPNMSNQTLPPLLSVPPVGMFRCCSVSYKLQTFLLRLVIISWLSSNCASLITHLMMIIKDAPRWIII
ncbi:hypothetical protein KP509_08G036500 [Ceratopteris richardii]|nr:hypothetical protein KP509_08G036500 [Ceratopteris richardii]